MDFVSHIYLNFFSLGALIPAIFMFFAGIFVLSIPKKTPASKWLLLTFFCLCMFNLPYFLASTIYHEYLVYHRFATGFFVLLAVFGLHNFYLNWPQKAPRKLTIATAIIHATVNLPSFFYFMLSLEKTGKIFNFRSMLWDFSEFEVSKIFGILIILNMLLVYGLGIWRALTNKNHRWAVLGLTFGFFLASLPPGIINVLSRDGLLSREIYQITLDSTYIVGFFIFLIVYINIATESITFMARIITITLATFLMVMTPVSYYSLNALEKAYQENHFNDALIAVNLGKKSDDLKYISYLKFSQNASPEFQHITEGSAPDISKMQLEMAQSYRRNTLYQKLLQLDSYNLAKIEEAINQHAKTADFKEMAYLGHLQASIQSIIPKNRADIQQVYDLLDQDQNKILYTETKISHLNEKGFRESAGKILASKIDQSAFGNFCAVALKQIQSSQKNDGELKQFTMLLFTHYSPPGNMYFRYNLTEGPARDQFTAFHIVSQDQTGIYEVGYSYLGYRAYIHSVAINLFLILVLVTFMILVIFRIFFFASLIKPLNSLIDGVREVNEGDLNIEIPVRVEDEIGFLTRSFNGMVSSIRIAHNKLQEHAEQLEDKVKVRTAELQNTLETVQNLKHQQDGDYFLTALLTRPLGRNQVKSDQVNVEFITRQKKVFSFKNKKDEIGGDLCKAHDISLLGRQYVVFLNADAMGKSMQGAGGALVIGSVFESIINRTQSSFAAQKQYPERWLKNVFLELHKVFESFDGSMLISLAMGIIDIQCGLLYYMNAEHPATALYRNKAASFIDEDMMFRKLGTQGLEGKLFIQIIQLQKNDILIAGSDGRDDLLLGENEQGGRLINEDEFLFLDIIKQTDGDIQLMPEAFSQIGDLTDDLSLLKIEYLGDPQLSATDENDTIYIKNAARHIQNGNRELALQELANIDLETSSAICKETALAYNQIEDYDNAIIFGQKYIESNPGDSDMIYRLSLIYKRIRRLEDAADLAERIRLRQPGNIKNLIHLADIYINNGNVKRAKKIIDMALLLEPENQKALIVQSHIESYKV